MSVSQEIQSKDFLISPKVTSLRQGDSTRRKMFQVGTNSFQMLQKQGDDNNPSQYIYSDDRYQQEQDSVNQTNNQMKLTSQSIMNRSDFKFQLNRPSLLSVERAIDQGHLSPKGFFSPKETMRSYSNILSSSQQNITSEYGFRNSGNIFMKSKTVNQFKRSQTRKEEFFEQSPKKKLRKSKTQKICDDTKTENMQKSDSKEDIYLPNFTAQQKSNEQSQKQSDDLKPEKGLNQNWKKRGISIITQVQKFLTRLQNLSFIRRYDNQTLHQFQVINDLSAFYDENRKKKSYQRKGIVQSILSLLKQGINTNKMIQKLTNLIDKKFKVFEPDQLIIIIWMLITINSSFFLLFLNPLFMAFQDEMIDYKYNKSHIIFFCMSTLPLIVMFVDVIIRLNTGYYKRGLIVVKRWNIAKHYIKHKLWLDIFLIFLFAIYDNTNINIMMLITILLIGKITQIIKELEDAVTLDKRQMAYYQLVKLSILVLFIGHFCGCIFWSVGVQTKAHLDQSWVANKFDNKSFYEKYISSLYWATVTMLTVGYGDIVPLNKIEKQCVIIIMIFSCGIYAYFLNQIGFLIEEITYEDKEFKQIYSQVSLFLQKRNLDVKLQTEVKRYYQYLHYEKHNYTVNGEELLQPLKQSLKLKVMSNINQQLLIKYKLFRNQFSEAFLQQLALKMKESQFNSDDKVWDSSDLPLNNKIFFVIRGQIIQKVNDQFLVKTIEEGGFFNEKCFMIDESPNISFVSTCLSSIVYLDKKDFLEVIKNFPVDYERYCKLRDGSKFSNFFNLDSKCETCNLFTHCFNNCPQVNIFINKAKIVYSLTQWTPQKDRIFQQRRQYQDYLQQSQISNNLQNNSQKKDMRYKRGNNARSQHYSILESVIDYLINRNPFQLDEDNLIEYMKSIFENNDNLNNNDPAAAAAASSPEQGGAKLQVLPLQLQNADQKLRSLIHPYQVLGSRLVDEINSNPKPNYKPILYADDYIKQNSGQESQQGSIYQPYTQQYSKTSTRGNQASIGGAHYSSQGINTPQPSNQSGNYGKRLIQTKTTSQTEIPSNENLKDLPNEIDIRHHDKYREATDGGRRRVSTTTRSQNKVTHSLTHNSYSPFPSNNQMALSSGAHSSYSAPPPLDRNNSDISIERSINYDTMLLQSNEQDELNVSEALKNLNKKKQNKINANSGNPNNSTFTILEEETQENQTNFQKTLFMNNTNIERDNTLTLSNNQNEGSSIQQTDLYPKIKDENSLPFILNGKINFDTSININMNNIVSSQNNVMSQQNNIIQNQVNTPNTITTPNTTHMTKRNSISNKYLNYIRTSSNSIPANPISPINSNNKRNGFPNKTFVYPTVTKTEEGNFIRLNSNVNSKGGGSQYGNQPVGEEAPNSVRNRKKTESSFNKQHSYLKYLNRIKEDATPKNNSKPKLGSNNFIPSLQNLHAQLYEEEVIFVSPLTHEFSDIPNLDKYHIYSDYFPHNNIDKVMNVLKQKYELIEKERNKKKSESHLSKLEKFMLKFNTKRNSSKKTRQSMAPIRSKTKKRTVQNSGIFLQKSAFHQQHSIKQLQ
ncbi:cation channel family protein (macronuclear) [Tetrahymena thermophila SB210]|uniref:Cation channel family protein n=1 Tax=Tetrahymena thermophila (strain SB210) TaxID=312017 RepID=I7MMR0_TETTS|nr:cation channel family protein [Tetrahymena thermophila SB210]EAS06232.2 cation channel family protein [Tetrahymena thermophila SB210]|eukprot:XP_001026477.2 cation channel family protein [Tetrahymena thermophila SB210]